MQLHNIQPRASTKMNKRLNPALTLAVASAAATSAVAAVPASAQMVQANATSTSTPKRSSYAAIGLAPSFYGSATIISGMTAMGSGHGTFAVASVKPIAVGRDVSGAAHLVLRSIGTGASELVQMSIRMSESALLGEGVAAGSRLQTIATAVGWAVRVNDRTIAFALNEHGRELMRQEKIAG